MTKTLVQTDNHNITKELLAEHDRLIPAAGPLHGSAEEATIPLISVLEATARGGGGEDPKVKAHQLNQEEVPRIAVDDDDDDEDETDDFDVSFPSGSKGYSGGPTQYVTGEDLQKVAAGEEGRSTHPTNATTSDSRRATNASPSLQVAPPSPIPEIEVALIGVDGAAEVATPTTSAANEAFSGIANPSADEEGVGEEEELASVNVNDDVRSARYLPSPPAAPTPTSTNIVISNSEIDTSTFGDYTGTHSHNRQTLCGGRPAGGTSSDPIRTLRLNKTRLPYAAASASPTADAGTPTTRDWKQLVLSSQNAKGNVPAAAANLTAVEQRMSNISRALAVTAALPEEERLRAAGGAVGSPSVSGFVDVSALDVERSVTVGAYILIDEDVRCQQPLLSANNNTTTATTNYCPVMNVSKRYHVQVPLHQMRREDPFFKYETAEQMVEQSNGCAQTWYEASEWFERAAQTFATLGLFRMAANCEVRQYDCLKATGRIDDAGQSLVAASHYYTQEALVDDTSIHREASEAALAAMQNAIGLYDETGRDVTAAKLCAEAAELCVKARNPGLGVDILHVSAETFIATGQTSHAERCFARAAEIAIMDMSDFAEAIDTLEKLAKITAGFKQHLVYFKALLCRLVCIPPEQGIQYVIAMEDCQKTFDLYTDICPQLLSGVNEYQLLKDIIGAQKHMEDDKLEACISRYLQGSQLGMERWTELILRKIHENLVQRKSSVEKLYKL